MTSRAERRFWRKLLAAVRVCLTVSERAVLRAKGNSPVQRRRAFMPSRTRVRSLSA
jgi:hypothetical protein